MKTIITKLVCTLATSLFLMACADDVLPTINNNKEGNNTQQALRFEITDTQYENANKLETANNAHTRAALWRTILEENNLSATDMRIERVPTVSHLQGESNIQTLECVTQGVNLVMPSTQTTRGEITYKKTLKPFTAMGFRGKDKSHRPLWFYNELVNPTNGTIENKDISWSMEKPYARIFAISPAVKDNDPYKELKIGKGREPYINFTVNQNVKEQEDLLTACTGNIQYTEEGKAPTAMLNLRHALTAVRFKVGNKKIGNHKITKITIDALSKGKFTLPLRRKDKGTWSDLAEKKTFTLDNVNISTLQLNNFIVGNNDTYTFLMIPQETKDQVSVNIYFDYDHSKPAITLRPQKPWKQGTTVDYVLNGQDVEYVFDVKDIPTLANFDEDRTEPFTMRSFKRVGGREEKVGWHVVGYDANGDGKFSMDEKPTWLTSIQQHGDGSHILQIFTPRVAKENESRFKDYLAMRNNTLKNAKTRGTSKNPYDLSTHDLNGKQTTRNTANCYLISAPGYYEIPLVYGNAIKDGKDNKSAYGTMVGGRFIALKFKDHAFRDIVNPYINEQDKYDHAVSAEVVWAENREKQIVSNLKVIEGKNGKVARLQFQITKEHIHSSNAVVAVKNKKGTIMWSWHLWFAPTSALQTIACTNKQGKTYHFTKETLGTAYQQMYKGTSYLEPRTVAVRIQQTEGKGINPNEYNYADIHITQCPGWHSDYSATLYQFGRKDAFPGNSKSNDDLNLHGGDNMSIPNSIQHPNTIYQCGIYWDRYFSYRNLWSANNQWLDPNDNEVVKTIFDPCPVGFKIPPSNAFTGFTTTGRDASGRSQAAQRNVKGIFTQGWFFNNKIENPDKLIYFPAAGLRQEVTGLTAHQDRAGFYWMVTPRGQREAYYLYFNYEQIIPSGYITKHFAFAIRPIKD